jgi:hypothetical protein
MPLFYLFGGSKRLSGSAWLYQANRRCERVATNAGLLFLEGLLGDEQRKTGWMHVEAAGDPGPWRHETGILKQGKAS